MLEEQVLEERDPDLNEEQDIRMEDSREDHWRDFSEDGEDNSNICSLSWDVYKKKNQQIRKRSFLVSTPHPEGGGIVWTCVKDDIIKEKGDYEAIGLRGFDYK